MRQITKIIPLKVNEETMNFRITRLDAFSGGKLLKMLSSVQKERDEHFSLSDFLFSLGDYDFEAVMRVCLGHAEVQLPAGFIPVKADGCWGMPELEYETLTCLKLTLEVMAFSLEDFFPESPSDSSPGRAPSSRPSP